MDSLDSTTVAMIVTGVIAVITLILYYFLSFRSKSDTILLVGLSDSGKTHIFSKIANKSAEPITYTSFQENSLQLDIKGRNLKIIDYPGAERLRKQLMDKYLKKERSSLRGIVFVVDSSSIESRARDVAEFLYDVALESGKKIPILTACNKQDQFDAKNQKTISTRLEKEIGMINKTRAAALVQTDGSNNRTTLTDTGAQFTWNDLPKSVTFVECSAVDNETLGLEALRDWIKQ